MNQSSHTSCVPVTIMFENNNMNQASAENVAKWAINLVSVMKLQVLNKFVLNRDIQQKTIKA